MTRATTATDISTLARELAGANINAGIDGGPGVAAWAELLQRAEKASPAFYADVKAQYDALAELGPDESGGQAKRIERLLAQLSTGSFHAVEGWADDGDAYNDDESGDSLQFASLWDEDEHPRDTDGTFAEKGSGNSRNAKPRATTDTSGEFKLTNARKGKRSYENVKTKQKRLLEGTDALPGQRDLFDGGEQPAATETPPKKPAAPAIPVEKRSYTIFRHPEDGYIDLRRLQLRQRDDGLHLVETYKDQVHVTPVEHEQAGFEALHRRIGELKKAGWRHREGPSGAAVQFATSGDRSARGGTTGGDGHWITIGAVPGADGKRHGGTPVKIVGGKIVAGPKRLRGKTLKGLSKIKPHLELKRAVKKAAKEHGLDEQDLHGAVELVHGERAQHHAARESAKEAARAKTGLTAGDVSRLANSGHDYASGKRAGGITGEKLKHFDAHAQELAREHPELGLGDPDSGDDFSHNLWSVLSEGKRPMPAKHHPEIVDEAVRLLHGSGAGRAQTDDERRRYEEMNAIPFSMAGGRGPDRGGARSRPGAPYRRLPRLVN